MREGGGVGVLFLPRFSAPLLLPSSPSLLPPPCRRRRSVHLQRSCSSPLSLLGSPLCTPDGRLASLCRPADLAPVRPARRPPSPILSPPSAFQSTPCLVSSIVPATLEPRLKKKKTPSPLLCRSRSGFLSLLPGIATRRCASPPTLPAPVLLAPSRIAIHIQNASPAVPSHGVGAHSRGMQIDIYTPASQFPALPSRTMAQQAPGAT